MPEILVCYKWVMDEGDIRVAGGSKELIMDRVGYKISDYDRNAIEEAVRLQEKHGGSVTAITVGPPTAKAGLKDALSRGPEKAYFISDSAFTDLEPSQTAAVLAAVIKDRLAFDLIICAEGSSDLYAQQVGPRLAELLNIPCATYVNKLTFESNRFIVERKLDDGIEVLAITPPALVTVLPDINTPRLPGLKQVLAAGKKPVVKLGLDDLGQEYAVRLKTLSVEAATMERRREKFEASDADIHRFVEALIKEGVIA
ncbi:MAG: electron transfer flavoprotein subunit beta/FixA family protein [Thermoanaerobacteraceae bacterium]|nr:electron transfer flavoprotein subunit beta/FixA family protein [Thermoanaerobacteraceae bacterium]